jgi:hypothetical protein
VTEQAEHTGARGAGLAGRVGVLLVVYVVVLAAVFFSPTNRVQTDAVVDVGHAVAPFLPRSWAGFAPIEVLLNVAIVAPVSFLGSMVWPRLRWQDWTAYGFVGATSVELIQGLLLPGRQASFSDVVANTAGALVGALLCTQLRSVRARNSKRRNFRGPGATP